MTVADLLALAVVDRFAFPFHGLWTVLTAVVVTNISIGGSLRATIEYMIGTLGGAIYAAALGVVVPHATAASQAVVLGVNEADWRARGFLSNGLTGRRYSLARLGA